jgi:hypothetical protein
MARYYSGKFTGAKKYCNCTFKHILEVMQGEMKKLFSIALLSIRQRRQKLV